MDDFHESQDDWTLLFISYFYILISYRQTDRLTLVLVKLLLQLKRVIEQHYLMRFSPCEMLEENGIGIGTATQRCQQSGHCNSSLEFSVADYI